MSLMQTPQQVIRCWRHGHYLLHYLLFGEEAKTKRLYRHVSLLTIQTKKGFVSSTRCVGMAPTFPLQEKQPKLGNPQRLMCSLHLSVPLPYGYDVVPHPLRAWTDSNNKHIGPMSTQTAFNDIQHCTTRLIHLYLALEPFLMNPIDQQDKTCQW